VDNLWRHILVYKHKQHIVWCVFALWRPQCYLGYFWLYPQLEKAAINDVLPLKAARRDGIANLKSLWGLWTPEGPTPRLPSYHQTQLSCQIIRHFSPSFCGKNPQNFTVFSQPRTTVNKVVTKVIYFTDLRRSSYWTDFHQNLHYRPTVVVPRIITCAKFQTEIFRDYDFTEGRIFDDFPINSRMGLTVCCLW